MPQLGNSLLIPILFGIFGFILGALLAALIVGRGKREDEVDERGRHPGAVRVWHEGSLGKLKTEIDGQTFSSSRELSNEQRQKLVRLLRDWASWLEVAPQTRPQSAAPNVEPPRPALDALSPVSVSKPKPEEAHLRPPAPPAARKAAAPAVDPKVSTQASIVAQINNILQEMLDAGSAKAKGIRLVEDALNGVTVWVGLQHFTSIDSVSDPEALALIRSAVAEWERRAEGKSA